jgi:hypothetical protein
MQKPVLKFQTEKKLNLFLKRAKKGADAEKKHEKN